MKRTYLILILIYANFFVLGLPDGAFGVSWPAIRYGMEKPLERAGIIILVNSFFYALASSRIGRLAKKMRLEKIDLLGTALMALGALGISFAPNFTVFVIMAAPMGIGMGMVDSSLNSFMTKHFTSSHLNWLHCFWGMGAAVSPILMTQMILTVGWRYGYAVIAAAQLIVFGAVVITILKKVWQKVEKSSMASASSANERAFFLTKRRHKVMAVLCCFIYGGMEYSTGFWISSVLLESRGMEMRIVGMFPAVYYACIMGGRLFFGFVAVKLDNTTIIRIGALLAFSGILLLFTTGSIIGIALTGLGFAPIFPCLIHETSRRFSPQTLTRLVGYQLAANGVGVAVLSSLIGQVLSIVSLEALFPIVMALIVVAFCINEILERGILKGGA
ncbi:MAG: MFS transporter [Treponema sp.]|nr:MFS transporter [Treponema sp.]